MDMTTSMTRLCGEIAALHQARRSFLQDLAKETREMKTAVATRRAHLAFVRAKRLTKTKGDLTAFVSDLKHRMARWRQDFRADLAGARRTWGGRSVAFAGHAPAEAFEMPERKKGRQRSV